MACCFPCRKKKRSSDNGETEFQDITHTVVPGVGVTLAVTERRRASEGSSVPAPATSSAGTLSAESELQPPPRTKKVRVKEPHWKPRTYANVNLRLAADPSRSVGLDIVWGKFDNYEIDYDKVLGRGSFGEVYYARKKDSGEACCIKKIVPRKGDDEEKIMSKLRLEVTLLNILKARPDMDVLQLWDTVMDSEENKMIVTEYVNSPSYRKLFQDMTPPMATFYLFHLMKALNFCHSNGIIHRDVKSDNCLFDPVEKKFRLIDYGLSDFYFPDRDFTKFPGTLVYKAPELFLQYAKFDYGVDIWAFGCVMASLIFQRLPHFFLPKVKKKEGEDSRKRRKKQTLKQMHMIVRMLGTEDFAIYTYKYRNGIRKEIRERFSPQSFFKHGCPRERQKLDQLRDADNSHLATDLALDLLNKCFVYDHELRITSKEALMHPYFATIREEEAFVMPTDSNSTRESVKGDSRSTCVCLTETSKNSQTRSYSSGMTESVP